MALRWWETVDIVESLANVTRQKATQVFGNIETRINQMEEQDIANQKAARQARAEAVQCAMKSQARAKAQVSIEEANKKLGALGCQNCLDSISSENLDRELSSNFQWSASMVRQYESESKQAREKAIYTQAEADAKILYENRTKKPWSKLLTAEKDAEISRWYQIYLKRAYPAEYGELTAEDRALATGGTAGPEAIPNLVQNQPWATQTTPQKTMEIPQDISEMTIPQGGVELGQGIRVMPDWSVWDSQNKIGTLNPKTQQFKAVGGGAGEGLKNLVVGFWNELNPSEYFTDPAKASLAQYKGTLVEWAKANSIPNPEEFVNNLFTAGTNSTGESQLYWNVRSGNEIFLPVMPPEQEGKTGEQFVSEWLMPMVMMALLPSPTKLTGALKVIEAGGGVIGGAAKVAGRVIAPLKWMEHPIETLKVARGVFPATAMRAEEKALYGELVQGLTENTLGRAVTRQESITVVRGLVDKIISSKPLTEVELQLYKDTTENVNNLVRIKIAERIKPLRISPKKIIDETTLRAVIESDDNWAVLSAAKGDLSATVNKARNTALRNLLKAEGYEFYPTLGVYQGGKPEAGFLVRGINEFDARRLGLVDDIAQDTVLTPRGFIYDNMAYNPVDLSRVKYGKNVGVDHTVVKLRGGQELKFSIPEPDWNVKIPLTQDEFLVSRQGFIGLVKRDMPDLGDITLKKDVPILDSKYVPAEPLTETKASIELGINNIEKYTTTEEEQETLLRLLTLHELGHDFTGISGRYPNKILNRELNAWQWALENSAKYGLKDAELNNRLITSLLKDAYIEELGKNKLLNTMRAEGLISKVAPNPKPVPQRVVPPTNGWEKVTRGSTSGANGQWEAQLVGENSKIILARETLDHKPLVKDFTALENKLKLQKEIRYDTKTGKYFKVRKTITTIGKTNWDILKGSPQVQKALAAGAGFSDNEIANIVGKNWADLNPLQRSALRASAIQPQSVEKAIAAWNRMSIVERKAAVKGTPLEKKVGSLAFGALGAREKAELRLTFLTERLGIGADNKLVWQKAGSQQMGVNPAEVQGVVQKLTQAIKTAKPIREMEKGLKHSELMRRAGKMAGIVEQYEGKEGFEKGWSAMKGKLPTTETQFAAPVITANEEMMLYNSIKRSPVWKPWEIFEQSRTATALTKVLAGILPLDNEFALLEKQFGSEFAAAIMGKRSLGAKGFEMAADLLNLPRAFLASWDLSAPLRQGALLFWGQPRQSIPALLPMIRAFGSDKFATMLEDAINTGAFAQLRRDAGLYLAPIHGRATGLLAREESFMTRFAGKLPMVKQSERAYVSYLNKLRADVFDNYAALWQGTKLDTVDNYKALAHAINVMTGRGDLPKWLAGGNQWLNAIFFSPRFMSSRIMLPVELIRTTPAVRAIMARNIVALTLANMSMFTLVYLATKDLPADQRASVEIDPRSTDFGKIKVGNTRVDFWGGFQPYARFISQLIMAERKTPDGMQALNRGDLIERFARSKLSPAAGLFTDIVKGETYLGDEFALTSEAVADQAFQRLVPMSIQDIYEAMDDAGVTGLALSMPSLLGANVQTYGGVKLTKDDLNSLSQALYYKNWDELADDERQVINDWIGQ